ncbi:MAG: glycosyl transferase [Proteobacteria bacterium]|nr:glycosyl transferase [Pseudomonadota bacterium]
MRIASLVLAHRDPAQLRRLLRRLVEMGTVYVHLDARADLRVFSEGVPPDVRWVRPRIPVRWGCMSVVWAALGGLRAVMRESPDYVHLLSGHDYPLCGADAMRSLLAGGGEFIEVRARPEEASRYERFHLDQWLSCARLRRPVERVLNAALAPRTPPLEIHLGSGWFTVTGALARYFVAFCDRRPDVMRFFRLTRVPDEMLFQSIAMQSPFRHALAGHNLRFIDFDGGPHPRALTLDDVPALARSGHLFARKFVPRTSDGALDAIDALA